MILAKKYYVYLFIYNIQSKLKYNGVEGKEFYWNWNRKAAKFRDWGTTW
jgi:hypothetical protein